jgi:3-hydroxybutyryl-CoA dehydrogenase
MDTHPIRTVAVLGAGIMGAGIAQVSALAGYDTRLQDITTEAARKGLLRIQKSLEKAQSLGKLAAEQVTGALSRLTLHETWEEAAAPADLVIEAVPEVIDLKLDVFRTLDRVTAAHAVLATNTSSMSVTEIAAATRRPAQVCGMHFFNPVPIMKLVEVIRGLETGDACIRAALDVSAKMGKETVVIKDYAGFATSRINALIGNEAFAMLEAGIGSARDIDKALKLGLNHPMGPFEMIDLVGLDTRLSILRYLHRSLGERFRPSPLLEKYVQAGRLGRKVGRGVYDYGENEGSKG